MTLIAPVVTLTGVSKRFGGTQALDSVDVTIRAGEVHALVGENGAGKSTLGKVITGLYVADAGRLEIGGETVGRWDPGRAQRKGVVMIAQELSLVPQLTVEQNVFLGIEDNTLGVMRHNLMERFDALEELAQFGLQPKARVDTLRIADLQKVEIMRALARDAKVIVMDEPTSSLTAHETQKLHRLILRLKEQGRAVVYVSHFLDSVLEISDRVTIMRDGRVIRTSDIATETKKSIVEGMLGREMDVVFPVRTTGPAEGAQPMLILEKVSSDSGLHDVSLHVKPGEIVGLLGLVGSGRTEIGRTIIGIDRTTAGSTTFKGRLLARSSPRHSMERGIVLVPEDRHGQGLVLDRSARENITLAFLRHFSKFGIVRDAHEKKGVLDIARRLDVRPLRIGLPIRGFSGGNQQKVLLAKWLIGGPSFIILDEPTRGVDVGAKLAIYELIVDLARQGIGVLLISSEHEEVLGLSHRAYVVSHGTITGEVDPASTTIEAILHRLFTIADNKESAA